MDQIQIPTVPLALLALVQFLSPYAIAVVTNPVWKPAQKKIVAIVVSILLTAVVLLVAYLGFGEPLPAWPVLFLLAVAVSQASYALITKNTADATAKSIGVGSGDSAS